MDEAADRDAIGDLVVEYATLVDAGDFDGVGALFEHGAVRADGLEAVGAHEVAGLYRRTTRVYPDNGTPHTKHVTTNVTVSIDGDEAQAGSYFTVFQSVPPQLALQAIIAGRYHDRFARAHGRWRFVERQIVAEMFGDLSHHLLIELPGQP